MKTVSTLLDCKETVMESFPDIPYTFYKKEPFIEIGNETFKAIYNIEDEERIMQRIKEINNMGKRLKGLNHRSKRLQEAMVLISQISEEEINELREVAKVGYNERHDSYMTWVKYKERIRQKLRDLKVIDQKDYPSDELITVIIDLI